MEKEKTENDEEKLLEAFSKETKEIIDQIKDFYRIYYKNGTPRVARRKKIQRYTKKQIEQNTGG